MKNLSVGISILFIFSLLANTIIFTGCKKKIENPVKFPVGLFPDDIVNIDALNTEFDDYNSALFQLFGKVTIVFSSNRKSAGGEFDLVQGSITFVFDQTVGTFGFTSALTNDEFLTKLLNTANKTGNDFGPFRFFSPVDGYEYLLLSSENNEGNLDMYYLKNLPYFDTGLPQVSGSYPISLLNTTWNEDYICLDTNHDSVYFSSDNGGDFDIYLNTRPSNLPLDVWFSSGFKISEPVDSINSPSNEKCPLVHKNIMVFASNRPGGFGEYDLYYSVFRGGRWSSPLNMGDKINTSSNEFRPVISSSPDFGNMYMVFSSDRPGGKGRFDLYFTGVSF
jgi:hypothetical protein